MCTETLMRISEINSKFRQKHLEGSVYAEKNSVWIRNKWGKKADLDLIINKLSTAQ